MKTRLSSRAKKDLIAIKYYIAQDNPEAAGRTITRILQSLEYLEHFPRLGRVGVIPDTRELSIIGLPYRAIYRIEGDAVLVVAIIHGARQNPIL